MQFPRFPVMALITALSLSLPLSTPAMAQGAQVAFGSGGKNAGKPVEISSKSLTVDHETGNATLTGDVIVGQGDMRISAPRVIVIYSKDQTRIKMFKASGGVTLVSGKDAAEAANAVYDIDSGVIKMNGNVLVVQKLSTIAADQMTVDTKSGKAQMQGNVKSILRSGSGD